MIKSLWRLDFDFNDLNMFEFERFENVMVNTEVQARVRGALSPFTIPTIFSDQLSQAIYDYGFGKMVNLKDTERWKYNFLGEISAYILEQGRYLQAYARDVNKDIELADTSKVTTKGEAKTGTADTKKTGNVENIQGNAVSGDNQQSGTVNLGDTLTVINNTTTSTNYLATANEESYSTGSLTETGSTGFGKTDTNAIKLGMENGASLADTKDKRVTDTEGVKSPLTVALEESKFNFRDWFEPLFTIIDTYFLAGGADYA